MTGKLEFLSFLMLCILVLTSCQFDSEEHHETKESSDGRYIHP